MNFRFYIFVILVTILAFANARIEMIHTFDLSIEQLNRADKDTLVIFDIDATLIMPEDRAFDDQGILFDAIEKYYSKKRTINHYNRAKKLVSYCKQILVENTIVKIIEKLQSKNIKIIAFTHAPTKYFCSIPNMGKFRFNQLNNLGINFNRNFEWRDLILNSLPKYEKSYPKFYNGILMTNFQEKGTVLIEFLKQLNYKPKKIIFFDDKVQNLYSVDYYLRKFCSDNKCDIEYIGYHYIRFDTYFKKDVNQTILRHQINFLLKKGIWLPTEQF